MEALVGSTGNYEFVLLTQEHSKLIQVAKGEQHYC